MFKNLISLLGCLFFAATTWAGDGDIRRAAEPVPGLYLVMLKDVASANVPSVAQELAAAFEGHLRLVYRYASTGFSAELTETQALRLARHPLVEFVEEVGLVHPSSEQLLPTDNSLWHLDRIDQHFQALNYKYDYCEKASSVYVYVIGSGVYRDHTQFITNGSSRVKRGARFTSDSSIAPGDSDDYGYWPCGVGSSDPDSSNRFHGHDTATASLVAGNTYGVAKAATIVPIRVIPCTGTSQSEWLNYAVDWIMNPTLNPYYGHRPAVVSMSVAMFTQSCNGIPDPKAGYLENEINKLVGHPYVSGVGCTTPGPGDWSGVPVVVSANNQNSAQSYTTPARMAYSNTGFSTCGHVISVGGVDESSNRWVCNPAVEQCAHYSTTCFPDVSSPPTGSNYGPTVDIFAPAHKLTLAGISSPTAVVTDERVRSGTSYAAPITAGLIARMQQKLGTMSADQAWYQLRYDATSVPWAIDPVTGNSLIVYRAGAPVCSPEYP